MFHAPPSRGREERGRWHISLIIILVQNYRAARSYSDRSRVRLQIVVVLIGRAAGVNAGGHPVKSDLVNI